ncbi:F-box protein At5g46170-like [Ananas comosus]|uniref:F-box protein At5g46170-like n=2 Tax=Ananas comosus TaxID=4615 RepID=A0A6P5F9L5_ANACO|nr:F-box protein At5g46170-like [Ananas comosus]
MSSVVVGGEAPDLGGARPWAAAEEEADADGVDHFDRLPDPILLVIFNRIGDVKALGRLCLVSRRFHGLVPLVDNVLVRVDCVISDDPSAAGAAASCGAARSRGVFSHLARLVLGGLVKPLQALGQIIAPATASSSSSSSSSSSAGPRRSSSSSSAAAASCASAAYSSVAASEVSHHSPSEVLKNFKEIRRLRIELPAGELGIDDGVLLKWRADFGSTLDSCVILAASSISPKSTNPNPNPTSHDASCSGSSSSGSADDNGNIPESFYTNGSLKLRVVWTISSLIAASARHYLLQPIIADHETLETLDLTDADGQGVLTMDASQLRELRVRPVSVSGTSHRTLMPALSMRLWYAQHLELPGGMALKGATLVAIRPSEERTREGGNGPLGSSDGCWVANAFEEPYRRAVRMLMKRRMYCLEMNSF